MRTSILWPWEYRDRKISGPAVVIDDISQSTNATLLLEYITDKYYLVSKDNWKQALMLHPDAVMIGESLDTTIPFSISNSPHDIFTRREFLIGKTIHHMSNNGTKRVYEALHRDAAPLYAACFGNLSAISACLLNQKYAEITIIPSGGSEPRFVEKGKTDLPEDRYCAEALVALLSRKKINVTQLMKQAKKELPEYYGTDIPTHEFPYVFAPPESYRAIPSYTRLSSGLIEVTNAKQ